MSRWTVFVFVAICNFACSSGGDSADAGTDASDGSSGSDPGPSDPGPRPDFDASTSFLLVVPEGGPGGPSLCTTFTEQRTWEQERAMLGAIDLKPGQMVLDRQEGFQSADLVDRILFGPERRELLQVSGGEFEATLVSWGDPAWRFLYRQDFTLDGQPYRLEMVLWVKSEAGIWPDHVILDQSFLSPGMWQLNLQATSFIGPGQDLMTERQAFDNCDPPDSCRHFINVTTERGNLLVLEVRCCANGFFAGETACRFFYGLEASLDAGSATVTDPFRLVYTAWHHNENEVWAVFLDEPLGATAALLISRSAVVHLDSSLQEIDSEMTTQWNIQNP
jgi:hypothetical protein